MEYIRAVGYEMFIDPLLETVRGSIANFVPENSTVIDIACGTGKLAFRLAKDKGCTVRGVDLSSMKIARAEGRKAKADLKKVNFEEADATCLEGVSDSQFDYATMSLFLHSIPLNIRRQVMQEAMRVAKCLVIADYVAEQPFTIPGLAVRCIERIAGGEHFDSFKSYRANGGLDPLLQEAGLKIVNEEINAGGTIRVVKLIYK